MPATLLFMLMHVCISYLLKEKVKILSNNMSKAEELSYINYKKN